MSACESCSQPTKIRSDYLNRTSAVAVPHPVRLLCRHCVERLGLPVERDGLRRFVRFRGHEYRLFSGMFLRSIQQLVVPARYAKSEL